MKDRLLQFLFWLPWIVLSGFYVYAGLRDDCRLGSIYEREECLVEQSNTEAERGMATYRYIQAEILKLGPDEDTEIFLQNIDTLLNRFSENIRLQCLGKAYVRSGLHNGLGLTPESAEYWRAFYRCQERENKEIADYLAGLLEELKKVE